MSRLINPRSWFDRIGSLGSTFCVVHCTLTAIAPGALALLGLGGHFGHRMMNLIMIAAVGLAALAALSSYRIHRSMAITGTFAIGMVGLLGAHQLHASHHHDGGMLLAIAAGLVLATTHLINLRTCKRCEVKVQPG